MPNRIVYPEFVAYSPSYFLRQYVPLEFVLKLELFAKKL